MQELMSISAGSRDQRAEVGVKEIPDARLKADRRRGRIRLVAKTKSSLSQSAAPAAASAQILRDAMRQTAPRRPEKAREAECYSDSLSLKKRKNSDPGCNTIMSPPWPKEVR